MATEARETPPPRPLVASPEPRCAHPPPILCPPTTHPLPTSPIPCPHRPSPASTHHPTPTATTPSHSHPPCCTHCSIPCASPAHTLPYTTARTLPPPQALPASRGCQGHPTAIKGWGRSLTAASCWLLPSCPWSCPLGTAVPRPFSHSSQSSFAVSPSAAPTGRQGAHRVPWWPLTVWGAGRQPQSPHGTRLSRGQAVPMPPRLYPGAAGGLCPTPTQAPAAVGADTTRDTMLTKSRTFLPPLPSSLTH